MKSLIVLNECGFSQDQIIFLKTHFDNVKIYNDTKSEKQAIERIGSRNIVIMDQFMWIFSERLLKHCKNLQLIIVNTTAYDRIPIHLLKKYNIKLSNLKSYASKDVAEVAIAMMLSLNCNLDIARKISHKRTLNIETYSQNDFVRDIWPGHPIIPFLIRTPLAKQTVGIVGLGNIGKKIASLCKNLGMKVVAFSRSNKTMAGIQLVSMKDLFKVSDIIIIALKYDPETMKNFISSDLLDLVKKNSILISIAPSELIDIDYLIKDPNKFRGLGFDYFVTDKLLDLIKVKKDNIIVTPHLGHQSYVAYSNLTNSIVQSATNFNEDKPLNLIKI